MVGPVLVHAGIFSAERNVEPHAHDGIELVFVSGGSCRIRTPDSEWLQGNLGDLFVTPAGIPHSQISLKNCETTYVVFVPRSLHFDDSLRVISLVEKDPLKNWIRGLVAIYRDNMPVDSETKGHLLRACVSHINFLETKGASGQELHPAVARALTLIRERLADPLTPDKIARHAGVSVSHLNLLFRKSLKRSPMKKLEELRVENACRILSAPYARINEAGYASGYEDTNYFVRVFKKQMGLPPGQWRKQL